MQLSQTTPDVRIFDPSVRPLATYIDRLKTGSSIPEQADFVEGIECLPLTVQLKAFLLQNFKAEAFPEPDLNVLFQMNDMTPTLPQVVRVTEVLRRGQLHVKERTFGLAPGENYQLSVKDCIADENGIQRGAQINLMTDGSFIIQTQVTVDDPTIFRDCFVGLFLLSREVMRTVTPAKRKTTINEQYTVDPSGKLVANSHRAWSSNGIPSRKSGS